MHKIEGKFRRVSETNYEAYLSAIGIGFAKRKMALVFTPEMEIKYDKDQDKWTFITTTPVKDVVINFKLDQPFPESSVDGREVIMVVNGDGNTFTSTQTPKDPNSKSPVVKTVREISSDGNTLNVQMICGTVVSRQVFQRIQ